MKYTSKEINDGLDLTSYYTSSKISVNQDTTEKYYQVDCHLIRSPEKTPFSKVCCKDPPVEYRKRDNTLGPKA
jgi:hypothetical protein